MPVECVWNIEFQNDRLSFPNRSAFDDREIFVPKAGTSPPGNHGWEVAKDIASARVQRHGARVYKCQAVGWRRVRWHCRSKDPGGVTTVAALPALVKLRLAPCHSRRYPPTLQLNYPPPQT